MKQDSVITLRDQGAATIAGTDKGLAGSKRRTQVLRSASAQFAMTGLHGTTMLALAQATGISAGILQVDFGDKTQLFREAVEINSETRLGSLDGHLSLIAAENQIDWIERMAEATKLLDVSLLPGREKLPRSTSFRTPSTLAWHTVSGLQR